MHFSSTILYLTTANDSFVQIKQSHSTIKKIEIELAKMSSLVNLKSSNKEFAPDLSGKGSCNHDEPLLKYTS